MLNQEYNLFKEIEEAQKSNVEYGNKIFELFNGNTNKNSRLNYEKVERNGIVPNTPFLVSKEKNIICIVYSRKHGISKVFFWGKRYIKEETARKKCNFIK